MYLFQQELIVFHKNHVLVFQNCIFEKRYFLVTVIFWWYFLDWFLYDNGLRHERVKLPLLPVKIYHFYKLNQLHKTSYNIVFICEWILFVFGFQIE